MSKNAQIADAQKEADVVLLLTKMKLRSSAACQERKRAEIIRLSMHGMKLIITSAKLIQSKEPAMLKRGHTSFRHVSRHL